MDHEPNPPGTAWYEDTRTGQIIVDADASVTRAGMARLRADVAALHGPFVIQRIAGRFHLDLAGGDGIHVGGSRYRPALSSH
jgi:streptogrisin B